MPSKATTLLLVVGLLGLLAVSACLADPLPQPGGGVMDPQGGPGAPIRQLRFVPGKYCWWNGHRYEPHSHDHGYYCCHGLWTKHQCSKHSG
jgi:hypothetical protein